MGKTTLILKCTIGCSVHLDGEFLTNLNQSEVKKVSIESGSHLLEFKTNYQTSTQIIQAVDGGNLVIFEEELRKKLASMTLYLYLVTQRIKKGL